MKKAILKKGRDWPLLKGHLWIFSGAIERIDDFDDGEILKVESIDGQFLGYGYFNSRSDIRGRIVTRKESEPHAEIRNHVREAIDLRRRLFDLAETSGFRLINAEGDRLPGLVVDLYGSVAVIQVSTLGMDLLKEQIALFLREFIPQLSAIYEISESASRKREGLLPKKGILLGEKTDEVEFLENGAHFSIHPLEGQKTGFFFDQREMRQLVKRTSKNKKVLNTFSYTGGFSVFAASGGALQVDSLDVSAAALEQCKKHMEKNGWGEVPQKFFHEDAFAFLEKNDLSEYGLVILDPPAFAKKRQDVRAALKGYGGLNRLAIRTMKPGSFLLTCSCSGLVETADFLKVVQEAAEREGKRLQILSSHVQAMDHPVLAAHPETGYLKSFFLQVLE